MQGNALPPDPQGADEREQVDLPEDVAVNHSLVIEASTLMVASSFLRSPRLTLMRLLRAPAANAAAQTMFSMTT